MNEDQHGGVTDDGFTKEQQDVYFHEDRCPCCRSEESLFAGWEHGEGGRSKSREVFCDDCEEEWVEVYYRIAHIGFLLKPGEVEDFFDDEDELEADDPDEGDDAADVSVTAASADTSGITARATPRPISCPTPAGRGVPGVHPVQQHAPAWGVGRRPRRGQVNPGAVKPQPR